MYMKQCSCMNCLECSAGEVLLSIAWIVYHPVKLKKRPAFGEEMIYKGRKEEVSIIPH